MTTTAQQIRPELHRLEQRRDRLWRRLPPEGHDYVQATLAEWRRSGELPAHGASLPHLILAAEDYARLPVPVRQFIWDEYYLGRALKNHVFARLVDDLEEFFEGDYSVALLAGGIGWGKSTFAEIAMLYDLYRVSCLRDPAVTFGMRPGSSIAFVNVSVTLKQARKVLFEGLTTLMQPSPYFTQVFPYDKKVKTELRFPKHVRAYPATASPEGVLGEGIFGRH